MLALALPFSHTPQTATTDDQTLNAVLLRSNSHWNGIIIVQQMHRLTNCDHFTSFSLSLSLACNDATKEPKIKKIKQWAESKKKTPKIEPLKWGCLGRSEGGHQSNWLNEMKCYAMQSVLCSRFFESLTKVKWLWNADGEKLSTRKIHEKMQHSGDKTHLLIWLLLHASNKSKFCWMLQMAGNKML